MVHSMHGNLLVDQYQIWASAQACCVTGIRERAGDRTYRSQLVRPVCCTCAHGTQLLVAHSSRQGRPALPSVCSSPISWSWCDRWSCVVSLPLHVSHNAVVVARAPLLVMLAGRCHGHAVGRGGGRTPLSIRKASCAFATATRCGAVAAGQRVPAGAATWPMACGSVNPSIPSRSLRSPPSVNMRIVS